MNTTQILPLTLHPRQPIIAFRTATEIHREPPPAHDFLVLSPCPDFTPEFATLDTLNFPERAPQLCT